MVKLLERKPKGTSQPISTEVDGPVTPIEQPQATTAVGVELDGNYCRAVWVQQGRVIKFLRTQGSTPAEALDRMIQQGRLSPNQPVRICWASTGVEFYDATNPPKSPAQYEQVVRELAERSLNGTDYGFAGEVLPPVDGEQQSVVVGIAGQLLDPIWEQIALRDRWQLIPACLVPQPDGLHVALRWSGCSTYVIQDGYLLGYAEMPNLGLNNLTSKVDELGRLLEQQSIQFKQDPQQAPVVGFMRNVLNETYKWVMSWVASGRIETPRQVWLHGEGGNLPRMYDALIKTWQGGNNGSGPAGPHLLPTGVADDRQLPIQQKAPMWIACRAAGATSIDPLWVIPSPLIERHRKTQEARRKRIRTVAELVAAVLVAVLAVGVPVVLAYHQRSNAQSALSRAQQQFAPLSSQYRTWVVVNRGQNLVQQVKHQQPQLAALYQLINTTLPPNSTINNMSVQIPNAGGAMQVQVQIDIQSPNPLSSEVSGWLQTLQPHVVPNSLASETLGQSSSGGTYTIQFNYVPSAGS
jgi:hypothetical protein